MPLTSTTTPLFWGLAVLVVAGAGFGAFYAERTAARSAAALGRPRTVTLLDTAWAAPVVSTIAAILLVATYHNEVMLLAGPAVAFFGNAGALFSRDLLDDATDSTQRTAVIIHTLVIHTVAFLALSAVYLNKMSSWVSAPLIGVLSGLLVLETLERGSITRPRRAFYAILGAALMTQAAIVLNWWPTHGWTGGAVLLVCFYLLAGVLLARTQRDDLQARDVLEFGVVSMIALVILAATA